MSTDSSLTATETDLLRTLSGTMIPADTALGMPGADDALIQADLLRSIGRDIGQVHAALAAIQPWVFVILDIDRREAMIADWYKTNPGARTLGRLLLSAYYRDDRVLLAIGHEARAPFPKGFEVEQGDWTLLDTVRARQPFWRDDRRLPPHSNGEVSRSYRDGGVRDRKHDPSARDDAGTSPVDGGGK